jgi:hypothetical protein
LLFQQLRNTNDKDNGIVFPDWNPQNP